jgi:hypothetical protein
MGVLRCYKFLKGRSNFIFRGCGGREWHKRGCGEDRGYGQGMRDIVTPIVGKAGPFAHEAVLRQDLSVPRTIPQTWVPGLCEGLKFLLHFS